MMPDSIECEAQAIRRPYNCTPCRLYDTEMFRLKAIGNSASMRQVGRVFQEWATHLVTYHPDSEAAGVARVRRYHVGLAALQPQPPGGAI